MSKENIPFEVLGSHFPAVEAEAYEKGWIRDDLLIDPRQKDTVLAHLLLAYRADYLDAYSGEDVLWTRTIGCIG